ncbi:MAG: DDE-type integrase/transposase/recombinase [Gammaproteobacteria bacterium]|nr:DDE-type integrase/transposase/recombinase [Gammaproteobacteria bacterium]
MDGAQQYLWRAVDQDGEVINVILQTRRDGKAARCFFKRLLKTHRNEPSPDISRRRTMHQKFSQYLNSLSRLVGHLASVRIVLFEFRKNWALYSLRSPLIHSCGYESDKRSHRVLSPDPPSVRTLHEL